MDSREIYKELFRHFSNYEYKLSNSFVYDWESDFFAMSKSGYFVEVEVKISRGDYFRDFGKEKHELFKRVIAGKTHHILHSAGKGDVICEYTKGELQSQYGPFTKRFYVDWRWEIYKGKSGYWANDYGHAVIRKSVVQALAPATRIHFKEIEKIHCPNQLYFACPDGLIKVEDLPMYAGLLYLTDTGIQIIKKAPYLHKRKQDMTRVLLQKFYNLWKYNVSFDKKLTIQTENDSQK